MEILLTQRLMLRNLCESDIDDFFEYSKNPNVGPNAGWQPHTDKQHSFAILKDFIQIDTVWGIIDKLTNKLIGSIGLIEDKKRENDNVRMLGYALSENFWGQGIMTEAAKAVMKYGFNSMNLDLISVYHYPSNKRSKGVIDKCGFRYEGILRQAGKLFDGNVWDEICYSITKQEYAKKSK